MTLSVLKTPGIKKLLQKLSFALLLVSAVLFFATNCFYSVKTPILKILPALALLLFAAWLLCGELKLRAVYIMGFGMLGWFVATRLIIGDTTLSQPYYFFAEMLPIYCFAFPFAAASGDAERRRFLDFYGLLFVAVTVAAAAVGIFCVMSGHYIGIEGEGLFTGLSADDGRLYIFSVIPTFSSVYMLLSVYISLYLLLRYYKRLLLIPMAAVLVICLWGLALTQCRMIELCLYFTAAPVAGILLFSFCKKQFRGKIALFVLAMLAASALCWGVITAGISAVNCMLPAAAEEAAAESAESAELVEQLGERSILGTGTSGRDYIVRCTFNYIRDNPRVLAFGASNFNIRLMTIYKGDGQYEMHNYLHNAYLQTLALTGLPGLLLAVAMLLVLFINSWRILFSPKTRPEEKLLPILLLVLVTDSLAESMILVPFDVMANTAFNFLFFLLGGYVTELGARLRKDTEISP